MLGESIRRRRGIGRRRVPRRRDAKPPRGGGLRWGVWLPASLAVIALSFGLGYLIAVRVLFPPPPPGVAGVRVPELVGLSDTEARRELAAAGLAVADVMELPHPDRPAGVVLAQSPLGEQQVPPGTRVALGVSIGQPRAVVPDVIGFTAERAAELLGRRGLQTARRDRLSDAPVGQVLGTEPAAGTELTLPATVTLLVSMGPPLPPPMEEADVLGDTFPGPLP
jgi:eukaryotic-like serine/threonine-protein kinase